MFKCYILGLKQSPIQHEKLSAIVTVSEVNEGPSLIKSIFDMGLQRDQLVWFSLLKQEKAVCSGGRYLLIAFIMLIGYCFTIGVMVVPFRFSCPSLCL